MFAQTTLATWTSIEKILNSYGNPQNDAEKGQLHFFLYDFNNFQIFF